MVIFGFVYHSTLTGQISSDQTRSNVEVMQKLIGYITDKVITKSNLSPAESIGIQVRNFQDYWIVEEAISSSLKNAGYRVFRASGDSILNNIVFNINNSELNVQYDNMFRDGLFGIKKINRTIKTRLSLQVIDQKSNEVLLSDSFNEQSRDTINADEVNNVELASAPSTHAEIPGEAVIDRLVEPFIIIGATGAVVYLFFYVRSK